MLKVFYYYYYLFYKKILPDPEPNLAAVLSLSVSEAYLIIYGIDATGVFLFCKLLLGIPHKIIISLIVIGINLFYYEKLKNGKKVVKEKPEFFKSHKLSIILTIIFFITSMSLLFWVLDYLMLVLESCK